MQNIPQLVSDDRVRLPGVARLHPSVFVVTAQKRHSHTAKDGRRTASSRKPLEQQYDRLRDISGLAISGGIGDPPKRIGEGFSAACCGVAASTAASTTSCWINLTQNSLGILVRRSAVRPHVTPI
jgi:hypothetical protein